MEGGAWRQRKASNEAEHHCCLQRQRMGYHRMEEQEGIGGLFRSNSLVQA